MQVFQEHPLMRNYPPFQQGFPDLASVLGGLLHDEGLVLYQPNTALLSLVLMLGTFFVAFFLRKLRNSRFLGGKVTYFIISVFV